MNESTHLQVIDRLKKEPCPQEGCLSRNKDNIELLVFDNECAKK